MVNRKGISFYLLWLGVSFVQVIASQVSGLVVSILFSVIFSFEPLPDTHPGIFVLLAGVMYATGIFFIGWLAIKLKYLKVQPLYALRLVGTLIGAYLPFLLAWAIYKPMQPGNPFFFIAIFTAILGFQIPGWFKRD
jgi:energy-converting hydrogenase Eha subunit A